MPGFMHGESNAGTSNLLRGVTPTEFTGTHGMLEQCVPSLLIVQPDLVCNSINYRLCLVLPNDL